MKNVIKSINQKGYTLAELAISTSILAMLAVGGLSIMGKKNEADNLKETYLKLEKIEAALESYIKVRREVPCPAGPDLSSDNSANNSHQYFGYSVAYNNVQADGDDSDFEECDNDASDDGNGDSDLNDDGAMNSNDLLPNATGAVPVRTLGLPDDYMYDGWDRKFTYRIAKSAGSDEDFDVSTFHGDIGIMDRKGIHKTDINNLPPNNNGAIYVIISHGSNGKGVAWGKNASTTPTQASGVEGQNTNHTSKNYIQSPKTDTFDDIVEFGLKKDVIQPFNITSPVDVSPLTCENATELVEKGRSTLNTLAGNTTATLANQIYANAVLLSELCDSAPTEIKVPSSFRGLVLWLDANDTNTVHELSTCNDLAEDNDEVECWLDKSDNGNNAISTTGPFYDAYDSVSDTGGMNNRNVLVANSDAGADFLRITNNSSLSTIQNNTFFFVGQINAAPSGASILSKIQNPGTQHFQYGFSSFSGQEFIDNNTTISSNNQVPVSRPIMYSWRVNPGQRIINYYQDGEDISQSQNSVLTSLVTNSEDAYLFSSNPGTADLLNAFVGEVVLYNTTLTNQERSAIEVYLSDKWSIELNNKNSELCPPGMEFIRDHEHPEGACQCITDDNFLVQELSSGSACLFRKNKFNDCAAINAGSPSYTNPPSSSGQVLWLDANDCTTITLENSSGQIKLWEDKSASGFDAAQTTTSNMPTYKQSNTNGLDTIEFDGSNDHFILGSNYIFADGTVNQDGLNIFAVAESLKTTAYPYQGYIVDFGNYESLGYGISFKKNAIDPYATNTNHINKDDLYTPSYAILHMNVDFTNELVMQINGIELKEEKADATSTTKLDDPEINQASTRGSTTQGPVTIGTSSKFMGLVNPYHQGNIGEVIIYDKKLTTYESLSVENYLSDKWAINNSPDDISSLELWLDANDTSTIFSDSCDSTAANSGDGIACWMDKSPNDNHAVQATPANRPTLAIDTADGAFSINVIDAGLPDETMPVIKFDGTNHYMTIPNHTSLNKDNDLSLFVLYNTDGSGSGDRYVFTKFTNANNYQYGIYNDNAGKRLKFIHKIGGVTIETKADSPSGVGNALRLYSGTVSSTGEVKSYFQGAQSSAASNYKTATYTTGAAGGAQLVIGADNTFSGKFIGQIAEIMFFSDELSESDREYIEQYLSSKWGVTINGN